MPFDTFFSSVFRMGARKPVTEFKQGVHSGDKPQTVTGPNGRQWRMPDELHQQVKGGFCSGASLDWLRKVLQREDRLGVSHLKESRVLRMANTYVAQKRVMETGLDHRVNPMREQAAALSQRADAIDIGGKEKALNDFRQAVKDWVLANGGEWGEQITIQGTSAVLTEFNQKFAQLEEFKQAYSTALASYNPLVKQANALRKDANALVNSWNASSSPEQRAMIWNEIATGMGTDAGKKRKFTGICPIRSSSKQPFPELKDFLVSALSAPGFAPGRGLYLSIALDPPPGHAIALHRPNKDTVLLFDPNLGVYRFTDIRLLMLALTALIELGYLGKDHEGKVTKLGTEHSWQVFGRFETLLPTATDVVYASASSVANEYDEAKSVIDMASQYAVESLNVDLQDAKRMHAAYQQKNDTASHRSWIAAHNDAVESFRRVRDADPTKATAVYSAFENVTYTLS